MFSNTSTFRADTGNNLRVESGLAARHYLRTFYNYPRLSRTVLPRTEHSTCTGEGLEAAR